MLEVQLIDEAGMPTRLAFDAGRVRRFTAARPKTIVVLPRHHAKRRVAECFIERSYERAYGSQIQGHYPILVTLQDSRGQIMAAAGVRLADIEPLFLEQYLDRPIERALERAGLAAVTRKEIAEIGSLTSNEQGASIFLFVALSNCLIRANRSIAVATATSRLRRIFTLVGLNPRPLAQANADLLPDKGTTWGRYYRTDPIVLAGSITEAHDKLGALLIPQAQPVASRSVNCAQRYESSTFAAAQA